MPSSRKPTSITTGPGVPPPGGAAAEDVAAALTAHITDPVGAHAASAISTVVGPAWHDSATNPAADAQTQLDKIITDLSAEGPNPGADKIGNVALQTWRDGTQIINNSVRHQLFNIVNDLRIDNGTRKIGAEVITNTTVSVPAGQLRSQLVALSLAANIQYAGGPSWAGGAGTITNPATNIEAQIDKIITDLAKTGGADAGVFRIGTDGVTTGTVALPAGHLEQRLVDLQNGNIRSHARVAWRGGRTNVDTDVPAAIDKIIVDLSAISIADDGAERIGAETHTAAGAATVDLILGSVRSQLNTLSDHAVSISNNQTLSGDNIFDGASTFNGETNLNGVVNLDNEANFTGTSRLLWLDKDASPVGDIIVAQYNRSSLGSGDGADGRTHEYAAQAGQTTGSGIGGDGGNILHQPGLPGAGTTGLPKHGGRQLKWGTNTGHFFEWFAGGTPSDTVSTSYVERIRIQSPLSYMHFVLEVQVMQWENNANPNNDTHCRMRRVVGTYGVAYGTPWDFGPVGAGYAWNFSTGNVADRSLTIGVDLVSTSTGFAIRSRNTAAFTGTEGLHIRLWVVSH